MRGCFAWRYLAALFLPLLAGACAYSGDIGEPGVRKFAWFSFMAGDDIRAKCQADSLPRYRMVYNGIYGEHVRIYELRTSRSQNAHSLEAIIVSPGMKLGNFAPGDILGPWRGTSAQVDLKDADVAAIVDALAQTGFSEPPPKGMVLPSQSYFWVAMGCANGRFHYNAWRYPSPAFDGTRALQDALLGFDRSGAPFQAPDPRAQYRPDGTRVPPFPVAPNTIQEFQFKVTADGLL